MKIISIFLFNVIFFELFNVFSSSENTQPATEPVVPNRTQFCFRTISDLPVYMNFGFEDPIINPPALLKVSVLINVTQEDPNASYKTDTVVYFMRPQSDPCPSHFFISNGQNPFSHIFVQIKLYNGFNNYDFTQFIFKIAKTAPEEVEEYPDVYGHGVVYIRLHKDRSHTLELMPTLRHRDVKSYVNEESFQKPCLVVISGPRKFILTTSMEGGGRFPIFFSINIIVKRYSTFIEYQGTYAAWPTDCSANIQNWKMKTVTSSTASRISLSFTLEHIINDQSVIYFNRAATNYANVFHRLSVSDVTLIKLAEESHEVSDRSKLFLFNPFKEKYSCSNQNIMFVYKLRPTSDHFDIQIERYLSIPEKQFSYFSKSLQKTKDLCPNPIKQ